MKKAVIFAPALMLLLSVLTAGCIRQPEAEVPTVRQVSSAETEEEAGDGEQTEEAKQTDESEQTAPEAADSDTVPEPEDEPREAEAPRKDVPVVKGIYITGPMAGHTGMADREQRTRSSMPWSLILKMTRVLLRTR